MGDQKGAHLAELRKRIWEGCAKIYAGTPFILCLHGFRQIWSHVLFNSWCQGRPTAWSRQTATMAPKICAGAHFGNDLLIFLRFLRSLGVCGVLNHVTRSKSRYWMSCCVLILSSFSGKLGPKPAETQSRAKAPQKCVSLATSVKIWSRKLWHARLLDSPVALDDVNPIILRRKLSRGQLRHVIWFSVWKIRQILKDLCLWKSQRIAMLRRQQEYFQKAEQRPEKKAKVGVKRGRSLSSKAQCSSLCQAWRLRQGTPR